MCCLKNVLPFYLLKDIFLTKGGGTVSLLLAPPEGMFVCENTVCFKGSECHKLECSSCEGQSVEARYIEDMLVPDGKPTLLLYIF